MISTGYLVMRWVTSRIHSCTPCRFSTAERVTFCKDTGGAQGQHGEGGGGGAQQRTRHLEPKLSAAGPNLAADLPLAWVTASGMGSTTPRVSCEDQPDKGADGTCSPAPRDYH